MIAASIGIMRRCATELADRDDQCLREQAALVEIIDEGREADIELWAQDIFDAIGILSVSVPKGVIDGVVSRFARPIDMHQANTGLNQAPGEQATLSPGMSPVTIAHLVWFAGELKRFLRLARSDEIKRKRAGWDRGAKPGSTIPELIKAGRRY